jgi:putative polyhydroxyalkanoic acid system protein
MPNDSAQFAPCSLLIAFPWERQEIDRKMHIQRNHNVGKEEAIHKIDTFLDDLMRRQFPGGVAIKEASKSWSDNVMRFSFKAKKGFIGAMISGVIQVNDDSVVMDSNLPGLITAFVSEDKIRNVINEQLEGLFPA